MKKDTKEISYDQALEDIAQILEHIENGELNIDRMAAEVKKAVSLIQYCKKKLFTIENEVNSIMETIDEE